jgi:hypothetical protein
LPSSRRKAHPKKHTGGPNRKTLHSGGPPAAMESDYRGPSTLRTYFFLP